MNTQTNQQTERFLNEILNNIWSQVPANTIPETGFTLPSQKTSKPKTEKRLSTVSLPSRVWYNVIEGFEYHLDVPGFTKEDLSLVYEDKTRSIVVSGNKSTIIGDHSLNRSVNQVIRIPEEAQTTVTATLENGVLILSVPREQNLRRNILIQ